MAMKNAPLSTSHLGYSLLVEVKSSNGSFEKLKIK
jgi:hypothetical protein